MTIRYALLGLLSWHPFTGYDLKKMISSSAIFYWSGSNNQIYNTLIHLQSEGFVTSEVQYDESSPTKKVYTITGAGLSNLKNWVLSGPEIPELRNTFLIQLAWADQLSGAELDALAGKYEEEVSLALLMQQEKNRRQSISPERTPREKYLWDMISMNTTGFYENELRWIRRFREGLNEKFIPDRS